MPGFRGKRISPFTVKRDIYVLMKMFPKVRIIVKRLTEVFSDTGERDPDAKEVIYQGEALVRPASGDTEGYGLGTVENQSLVILILGVHGFRQGDIVTVNDGREYEVDFPPEYFEAFTQLNLQQRSQIGQS